MLAQLLNLGVLGNGHVFRHWAPLFIAQVDPERLQVLGRTERIAVPECGARLGNFGIVAVSERETWITVAEWMQTWPPNRLLSAQDDRLDRPLRLARIHWEQRDRDGP
jgi:hypothetical protein